MIKSLIQKLNESNLTGRGGGGFPTGKKWKFVRIAKGGKKYVICNASEGEPFVKKDEYIIKNYPKDLIDGISLALKTVKAEKAFIFINKKYYKKYHKNLEKFIKNKPIEFFVKHGGYLSGDETTLLNEIEGQRIEPRAKPPFPTEQGLYGSPTLINNVETFYWVSKIAKNKYKNKRFYSIYGDIKHDGVYEFDENLTIKEILKKTNNYPDYDFFVQVGGGAVGEILLKDELNVKVSGAGSITVFKTKKTNIFKLMKFWAKFFNKKNCDKCVPCREGIYRILEMLNNKKIDKELMSDILFALENTAFCPLGKGAAIPFKTLLNKKEFASKTRSRYEAGSPSGRLLDKIKK